LLGATVDGGWPAGHEPQDDLHTLGTWTFL